MQLSSRNAALLLVILTAINGVHASSSSRVAAPVFAWSTEHYLQQGARTSYQVVNDLSGTLQRVVSNVFNPSDQLSLSDWLDQETLAQHQPEVLLLVLGSQVQTSDLRTMQHQLKPLQELMQSAQSSLSLPYVMHQVTGSDSISQNVPWEIAVGGVKSVVAGCDGGLETLADALAELGDEPGVVTLCTAVPADLAATPEGVAAELQQLEEAHNAVAALKKRQLSVYALRPDAGMLLQQRRHLLAANADEGTCGALCQTQVKWLEGILAAFILALAAFSGMCCLYMLDTPTRFEKPKEGTRND